MAWELTGNAGSNPATNFLGTTDNEPLIIKTNGVQQLRIDPAGSVNVGTYDTAIPYPKLTVTGPDATVNIETAEILRVTRHAVSGVKNHNSAGFFVGAFEQGVVGRSRLDINVAGMPGNNNTWGSVPDVTVMSLLGNGNVGIGTTTTEAGARLEVIGGDYGIICKGDFVSLYAHNNTNSQIAVYLATDAVAGDFQGDIRVSGGIHFGDGSVQTTATLQGPKGDRGPQGPPGLQGPKGDRGPGAPHTSAVCGPAPCGTACSNLVAEQFAPCTVTSDTGTCTNDASNGYCCVCTP